MNTHKTDINDAALDILEEARDLLASGAWTKEAYAEDKNGMDVDALDSTAVCWCSLGAVYLIENKESLGEAGKEAKRALNAVLRRSGGYHIARFNDQPDTKLSDVLFLFDTAIEDLECRA